MGGYLIHCTARNGSLSFTFSPISFEIIILMSKTDFFFHAHGTSTEVSWLSVSPTFPESLDNYFKNNFQVKYEHHLEESNIATGFIQKISSFHSMPNHFQLLLAVLLLLLLFSSVLLNNVFIPLIFGLFQKLHKQNLVFGLSFLIYLLSLLKCQ